MDKTVLKLITYVFANPAYIYGPGWADKDTKNTFEKQVKEAMNQCQFDQIVHEDDDKLLFCRGEEFIKCAPIRCSAYVSEMSDVEIQNAFKQAGIDIINVQVSNDEFYYYNKAEFVELIESHQDEIIEQILEEYMPKDDNLCYTKDGLQNVYLGFNYICQGTNLSNWFKKIEREMKEELFNDLICEGRIVEVVENSVTMYKTKE